MNSHFNEIGLSQIVHRLKMAEESAYWSEYDGCAVIIGKCANCEGWFEEQIEAAQAKIRRGEPDLCIKCDAAADVPSVKAVYMLSVWMAV